LRREYWQQVKHIEPENLVFIDEMGVLLGLTAEPVPAACAVEIVDFKPILSRSEEYSYLEHKL
jgi:hypothetical protein